MQIFAHFYFVPFFSLPRCFGGECDLLLYAIPLFARVCSISMRKTNTVFSLPPSFAYKCIIWKTIGSTKVKMSKKKRKQNRKTIRSSEIENKNFTSKEWKNEIMFKRKKRVDLYDNSFKKYGFTSIGDLESVLPSNPFHRITDTH